jgi:hypothetical protein
MDTEPAHVHRALIAHPTAPPKGWCPSPNHVTCKIQIYEAKAAHLNNTLMDRKRKQKTPRSKSVKESLGR